MFKLQRLSVTIKETHIIPPPAGPIALKSDIKVMAIPFAFPLWSWSCRHFVEEIEES